MFPPPSAGKTSPPRHPNTLGIVITDHLQLFIVRNVQRKTALAHTNPALGHFPIPDDTNVEAASIVNQDPGRGSRARNASHGNASDSSSGSCSGSIGTGTRAQGCEPRVPSSATGLAPQGPKAKLSAAPGQPWPRGIRASSTQSSPGREENHPSTKTRNLWLRGQPLFEREEVLVRVCFDFKRGFFFSLSKAEGGQR